MGFWHHGPTNSLVIGFRGTDMADPERFLGFVPIDYVERLSSVLKRHKTSLELLDYNTQCQCEEPINCKPDLSAEDILKQTTASYCAFGPGQQIFGFNHKLKKGESMAFKYDFKDIKGGENRCLLNSDCFSDQNIYNGTVSYINEFKNDPKHNEVSMWTVAQIPKFSFSNIIFAGHSLGGSLAFFTYLKAIKAYSLENVYFCGFNAASMRNFDTFDVPTDLSRCEAHRIRKDIVSRFYGKKVPTVVYQRPDMTNAEDILYHYSGSNIHGIHTFMCNNYNIINKFN